ncbi:hypothetical protein [Stenotrophomonas maltophilia]|uniref:hypothetical protein n=1 Tax=Stenotrophomonas maltophilia TaxID=40324 RepID=UPI002090751B|nr:hypothetical protein [Stenotrophomonas maltophilia]MCO5735940.1 hypothetical protein [Stenotrophomonas maltophilia]
MSIRTAIRNLKAALPAIKEHLSESKAGINELKYDLYSDVEAAQEDVEYAQQKLYVAKLRAKEILREEQAFNRAITKNHIRDHAKALFKGAWSDLKLVTRFVYMLPFALVIWLLIFVIGGLVTCATFSFRCGREAVENLSNAL